MRYLSWLFIIVLMYLSWSAANTPLRLAEGTHIDIQDDIKMMIVETMNEHLPGVQSFQFENFWTENLENGDVRAEFSFSFENANEPDGARYGVSGYAALTPGKTKQVWNITKLVFNQDAIQFKDGLVITPNDSSDPTGFIENDIDEDSEVMKEE